MGKKIISFHLGKLVLGLFEVTWHHQYRHHFRYNLYRIRSENVICSSHDTAYVRRDLRCHFLPKAMKAAQMNPRKSKRSFRDARATRFVRQGFTLIELLVVIAIIAILAAMLL